MITRLVFAALGIGLVILIVLAALESPIGVSFSRITEDLWGWVTLADLYLGFLLIALFIAFVEGKGIGTVFWIVPLFFLGNVWSVLWLVIRWNKITHRLVSIA